MFNKILAGLVMGLVVAFLGSFVAGLTSGGGARGGNVGLWSGVAGFVLTLVLAVTAARGRYAWGRGMLVSGLLCFAMPLASMLFTAVFAASHLPTVPADSASRAGATIGVGLVGATLTFITGVIGLFLGLIFVVASYFLLRVPRNMPTYQTPMAYPAQYPYPPQPQPLPYMPAQQDSMPILAGQGGLQGENLHAATTASRRRRVLPT